MVSPLCEYLSPGPVFPVIDEVEGRDMTMMYPTWHPAFIESEMTAFKLPTQSLTPKRNKAVM